MKTLPRKIAAAILTMVLAASAFAGQIQCPGAASTDIGTSPDPTEISTIEITATTLLIVTNLPPF